jgi:hypothetical protein
MPVATGSSPLPIGTPLPVLIASWWLGTRLDAEWCSSAFGIVHLSDPVPVSAASMAIGSGGGIRFLIFSTRVLLLT